MSRARDIANYGDGIDTSSITSGTFADARIAQSNVTQHESAIDALASNPTITLGSNTTFPSNTIEYIGKATYTSSQSNTVNSTNYTPAGIYITIPSATVAKYSKIKITFSQAIRITSGTYTWIDWKIARSDPTNNVLQEMFFWGPQAQMTSFRSSIAGAVIDDSLVSGSGASNNHTYKFYAKHSATNYAGTVYLDGTTSSVSWMIAEGIV